MGQISAGRWAVVTGGMVRLSPLPPVPPPRFSRYPRFILQFDKSNGFGMELGLGLNA